MGLARPASTCFSCYLLVFATVVRPRLLARRLSFRSIPSVCSRYVCFVCCCSHRSHPPPPPPSLPLSLFHLSLSLALSICLIVSPSHFTRQESPRQLLSICSASPPLSPSPTIQPFLLPLSPLQSLHRNLSSIFKQRSSDLTHSCSYIFIYICQDFLLHCRMCCSFSLIALDCVLTVLSCIQYLLGMSVLVSV